MRALAAFAFLMLLTACQAPPAEMTQADFAQIEAEVMDVGDQWLAAVNGINTDAAADLFDPAGTHAVDGGYYANYQDWVAHLETLFSTWEEVDTQWKSTRVEVLAPDAAVFVGEGEGVVTRTNGTVSNLQSGITLLMKKTEGVWKITFQGSAGRWTPVEDG